MRGSCPIEYSTSNQQTNESTTSLLPSFIASCCSSLDPMTKDGALGLPVDLGQPNDVLALRGSLPGESFCRFFAIFPEN